MSVPKKLNIDRKKSNGSIQLKPGAIVACDLTGGVIDHTGVYVGNGQIVELNGDGLVEKISMNKFLHNGFLRTGNTIYTPTWNDELLFHPVWGIEAQKNIGLNTHYDLALNNCHNFVHCCTQLYNARSNQKTEYQKYIELCNRDKSIMIKKSFFQSTIDTQPTYQVIKYFIEAYNHTGITTFETLSNMLFIHYIIRKHPYLVEDKKLLNRAKLLFKWKVAEY